MEIELKALAERPPLARALLALDRLWPTFMLKDSAADLLLQHLSQFLDCQFAIIDSACPDEPVGRAITVPVPWHEKTELPARGWDAAIEVGVCAALAGELPRGLAVLEITLTEEARGMGHSRRCLQKLIEICRTRNLDFLFAPVRPTTKMTFQTISMAEFMIRNRSSAEVADPWLRTHIELGGEVMGIAPFSMTIHGTFEQWREWTGLDLHNARAGEVFATGGLGPILINHHEEIGVYIEPNVWIRHKVK